MFRNLKPKRTGAVINPKIGLLANIIFPKICLGCHILLGEEDGIVCTKCLSDLAFLKSTGRCRICFSPLDEGHVCRSCKKSQLTSTIICFENEGVVKTLCQKFTTGRMPYLDKLLASLLFIQLNREKIPLPEIIIPLQSTLWDRFGRGFSANFLLAKQLGILTNAKVITQITKNTTNHLIERRVLLVNTFCNHELNFQKAKILKNLFVKSIYVASLV